MLLLHSIVEEEKEKYDIIESAFRLMSFSAPGVMFGALTAGSDHSVSYESSGQPGPGEKVNMEFERHRLSAQQTGKVDLSPPVRAAFNKFYNKPKDQKNVIRLSGPLPPEDETLGD